MQSSPRVLWQVSAVLLLVAIGSSCRGPEIGQSPQEAQTAFDPTATCPNIATVAGDTLIHMRDTINIPLAGVIQDIPEYHDCQRLRSESNAGRYGPLVGVWARMALGTIDPDEYQQPTGTAVAELFSWDGPYAPLGIRPGYNCLYLRAAGTGMEARMQPMGMDSVCKTLTPEQWNAATRLQVRVLTEADNIPPVAKWDIEPQGHHYIGLRCLNSWCEVGAPGFTSSADRTGGAVERVKGWYDEQRIADDQGTGLQPSYWAAIIPYPELDGYTEDHFKCDPCTDVNWRRAAYVMLDQGPGKYTQRYGLLRGRNEISLRYNTAEDEWEAKIQPETGSAVIRGVLRVVHEGLGHVPGTARWRWLPNDETAWMRCGDACCTVE